jgi:hypothetical protein
MTDLAAGWSVVGNDGRRIGKVREVGQHFIEVSTGRFSSVLFVPASAVANVERETVQLNLAHDEVEAMGWEQPPRSPDELHTAPESDAEREI